VAAGPLVLAVLAVVRRRRRDPVSREEMQTRITPTDLEAVPEPVAPEAGPQPRGRARATFANGTAPSALVTDGDGAVVDLVRTGAEAWEALRRGAGCRRRDLQGAAGPSARWPSRCRGALPAVHALHLAEHRAAGQQASPLEPAGPAPGSTSPAKRPGGLEIRKAGFASCSG
jgi:hypothetical protein